MDIHQARADFFKKFKDDKNHIYVLHSPSENSQIPSFVFRKLDLGRIAILAWMTPEKAEEWCNENNFANSQIITLTYSELNQLTERLNPDQRKMYTIELI